MSNFVLLIEFSPAQIIFSLPRISLAVRIHVCMFIIHDGERRKPSTAWKVSHKLESSAFRGQTWVFRVLDCWLLFVLCLFVCLFVFFFSQTTVEGHYQQVVAISNVCSWNTFVFWQCSLLIGRASSLNCDQSVCGVVYFGYARSIFWLLCDDQKCSSRQNC